MLWSTGMRLARTGAYFCKHCIHEDVPFHGRSYWRRAHQIPGLLWCPKHLTPLSFTDDRTAFLCAPSHLIGKHQEVDAVWCEKVMANETVMRFLAICDGLMDHPQPFSVAQASEVLREAWMAVLGSQASQSEKPALFSDWIIECCGRDWLALVLPDLANKLDGARLTKIDSIFFTKTSAAAAIAYALACAALFSSADEALNALNTPTPLADRPRMRKRIDLDPETLFAAYIEARGSHAQTAEKLGFFVGTIACRLNSAGLPNMVETPSKSTVKALSAFLIERHSLQSSSRMAGISQADLEYAIRVMAMGETPSKLILQLLGARQSKTRRKIAQLTPDQVRNMSPDIFSQEILGA